MRPRKSPQERKCLSLERDRRNAYGGNDKASRKSIPRAKARVNRANRRAAAASVSQALGARDGEIASAAEESVESRKRKIWRKYPDERLGDRLRRRAQGE